MIEIIIDIKLYHLHRIFIANYNISDIFQVFEHVVSHMTTTYRFDAKEIIRASNKYIFKRKVIYLFVTIQFNYWIFKFCGDVGKYLCIN